MENTPVKPEALDLTMLRKELDWVQSRVFMGKTAAFLSSIMCSMNFVWTRDIPSAQTNGVSLWWNPEWFLLLPRDTRKTVLVHELHHPGRMHFARMGNRNPKIWNFAADTIINNDLERQGYTFEGWSAWRDTSRYGPNAMEEDVYDDLIAMADSPLPDFGWGSLFNDDDEPMGDMVEPTEIEQRQIINNVVRSIQLSKMAGEGVPGQVEEILNQFLSPVLPWHTLVRQWMTELMESRSSWRKPNRRYELYLPSRTDSDGRLDHLIYFFDVSGSVSDGQVTRFNSEVYYLKTTFKPKKLTLVQFDEAITKITVINEEDDFNELHIVGRGGTRWAPVKAYLEDPKNEATAAIVFSDMGFFDEVTPVAKDVPIMFVCIDNPMAKAPDFGRMVHVKA